MARKCTAFLIALLSSSSLFNLHAEPAFILLRDVESGFYGRSVSGLSSDGSVVVGNGWSSRGDEAFRWSEQSGMVGLGAFEAALFDSSAAAVSDDGNTITGRSYSGPYSEPYLWTASTGMVELGLPDGASGGHSSDMSADGSIIIGGYGYTGFRWNEQSGFLNLDPSGDYVIVAPQAITGDGSTIVGLGKIDGRIEAFRWKEETGIVGMAGGIDSILRSSSATDISDDGSIIVGYFASVDAGREAFRWTEPTGMVAIESLFNESAAMAVSADGTTIVGYTYEVRGDSYAFRWTEESGMQTVVEWLAELGVSVNPNYRLRRADAVSADGNAVAGTASGPDGYQAYLARSSTPTGGGSGMILIEEFIETFGTTASVPLTSIVLPTVILNGAHQKVLLTQDFADQDQMVWVNGDFADHDRRDAEIILGEVGIAHDFRPGLRGGLAVGHGEVDQDLTYDGEHELDGQFLVAELGWQMPESNLIFTFTGIYGDWDAYIKRGYTNGGIQDMSRGKTDVQTVSGRFRVDLVDAFSIGGFSFTPRAAFTLTQIDTDSYTETGGGFPVAFDSMSHLSREFRFGLTGEKALSEKTTVRGIFEAVRRFDENSDNFSGQVLGAFNFSFESAEVEQDWFRAGAEVSQRLSDDVLLTATFFAATEGEDPKFSGALNLQYLF